MSKNPFLNKRVVKATLDIPNHPSFAAGALVAGSYSPNSGKVTLPVGAVVTDAYYVVETTCTTAGADAGTMALGWTGSTGAIKAAIAVSAAVDVYDAGIRGGLIGQQALDGNALTAIASAAAVAATKVLIASTPKNVLFTIATQSFTAGKIHLYVEYVI